MVFEIKCKGRHYPGQFPKFPWMPHAACSRSSAVLLASSMLSSRAASLSKALENSSDRPAKPMSKPRHSQPGQNTFAVFLRPLQLCLWGLPGQSMHIGKSKTEKPLSFWTNSTSPQRRLQECLTFDHQFRQTVSTRAVEPKDLEFFSKLGALENIFVLVALAWISTI